MNDPSLDSLQHVLTRRQLLRSGSAGIGSLALGSLLAPEAFAKDVAQRQAHFAPKAKRIIFLFMNGAPSQQDLFDYKPMLERHHGKELFKRYDPSSKTWSKDGFIEKTQRLTGMTSGQSSFPVARSHWNFSQYGQSRAWISALLPHTAKVADDLCFVKSMHTEAINHDPGVTFFQTGHQQPGRPSMGAWMSYGLGSANSNLPTFCVLISNGTGRPGSQPVYTKLWGSGFLPSVHQGVQFRGGKTPVLYLNSQPGESVEGRRRMIERMGVLNKMQLDAFGDPEIATRIAQYEMSFRMQMSVPEATDITREPKSILALYGPECQTPGKFAANCLLARRLAERGVRFVQLYHRGWDQHGGLIEGLPKQCQDVDQASAALITDLKQRSMLDDTLVVWGGEFGRTTYSQGKAGHSANGRDHHPRCFTYWMAGGGIKPGFTYGESDELGYNVAKDPVHVHDFQATVMHLMGVDHERLTFKYQGRRFRLTDVHGKVVKPILG
ncbi:MAG: hypothetical protein ACI8T1_003271 [Verrucomicrobiales bacterium]|jgi:hypothetical protein